MANEIGSNLNGAATSGFFPGDQGSPVALSAIFTPVSNGNIVLVGYRIASVGSCTTASIGLYAVNGSSQPTGAPLYTRQAIATGGSNGAKTSAVSWAVTASTPYVLAINLFDAICSLVATAQANGSSLDDSTAGEGTFTHRSYLGNIIDVWGDFTADAGGSGPLVGGCLVGGLLLGSLAS
jgi:hypothetical protein